MTQAPTPGPLDWDYDKVEMIADLIEKYTYVMSKHNPDLARVAGHNSCAQHILAALAPTAPVEASGSELWPDDVNREEFLRWIAAGKPSPQPSGETREAVARVLRPMISSIASSFTFSERETYVQARVDEILALLSARPLALGGQQGLTWLDVKDAPQDGSEILLNHRTHGIIQGWFSKGEWSDDTPISPREYSGDMWVLGDDLQQDEVEFGEHGEVVAGSVLGWLPLTALSTTPARAEAQDEGAAGEPVEDLWQELCERDDRTSPDEYPEMCLITFDELSDFIGRAHPSPTPAAEADRVRIALEAITKAKGLDVNLLHDGYDSGAGGGNYVYADVVRTDELFPLPDQALAALKSTAAKEGGEV